MGKLLLTGVDGNLGSQAAEYLLEHETMDAETFEKVFTDQWDGAPAPTQAQTAPDLPAPPAKEEHYDDRD